MWVYWYILISFLLVMWVFQVISDPSHLSQINSPSKLLNLYIRLFKWKNCIYILRHNENRLKKCLQFRIKCKLSKMTDKFHFWLLGQKKIKIIYCWQKIIKFYIQTCKSALKHHPRIHLPFELYRRHWTKQILHQITWLPELTETIDLMTEYPKR